VYCQAGTCKCTVDGRLYSTVLDDDYYGNGLIQDDQRSKTCMDGGALFYVLGCVYCPADGTNGRENSFEKFSRLVTLLDQYGTRISYIVLSMLKHRCKRACLHLITLDWNERLGVFFLILFFFLYCKTEH